MAALDDVVSGHPPSQLAARELHVLAVDDSLVDRTVVERLLKISSCKVTALESGTRALQYLGLDGEKSSVQFDDMKVNLIMTDYSMPGMTGYELLKKIKESKAFKEVPVVIMSSENVLTQIDRCLEEGAEDYIVKPVKLSDVRRLKDFLLKGDTEEHGEKGAQQEGDYIVKPVKLSDVRRLKDFLLKGDPEEHGEKGAQQEEEEIITSLTSPSQPTKVSPIIAFTTSSLLCSSSETLAKWPRLFCNVD